MSMVPLSAAIVAAKFAAVRLIATDMDGTLTTNGKLTAKLLQAFDQLADAGIAVLITTGRSAGWVSGLVNYLPIWGAIAENGGLFYARNASPAQMLVPIANAGKHRQALSELFQQLQAAFPKLRESADNRFRLTDWTFDVQALTLAEIVALRDRCYAAGWGFTYSNVQCHIKLLQQDKAAGLQQVLRQQFPDLTPQQVLTVGDSPNDESLFDPEQFPLSVGVANVRHYTHQLRHQPTFVTAAAEGAGFAELVQSLREVQTPAG